MKNGKLQILTVILVAVLLAAMVPFALATETETWGEWTRVSNPDCVNPGEDQRTSNLGNVQTRPVAATGHNFGAWQGAEATCTAASTRFRICVNANCPLPERKDYEVQAALGHSLEFVETVPATCNSTGTRVQRCTRCKLDIGAPITIPKLNHAYTFSVSQEPTCVDKGTRTGICSKCGDEIKKDIPALGKNQPKGHDFGAWSEPTAGNCKTEKTRDRVCTRSGCGYKQTEKLGKGKHVVKTTNSKDGKNTYAWFLKTKPSMQGPGRAVQYCAICGKVIKSKEIKFEGGRYNIPVTGFGPRAANVNGSLSGSNDRLIPVDFTNTEPQMFGLITNDGVLVGQIHLRVMGDTVSVNYTMNDMETVVNQAVFFLYSDAASLTAADLTDMTRAHQFGETIPLNGQTFGVLAARLVINYNGENAANRPFSESGLYLDGVTNNATILQEMTANLLGQ